MSEQDARTYDPGALQRLLNQLLEKTGESHRQASQAAGLHHTVVSKYMRGVRPGRDACIALADHFGVNPNEMLQAAGYEPLHFFDRALIEPEQMSEDVRALAAKMQEIKDPEIRRRLIEAMRVLAEAYLQSPEAVRSQEPDAVPKTAPATGEA